MYINKETEWERFVLIKSIPGLTDLIPGKFMAGWVSFVHLYELRSHWKPMKSDVTKLGQLWHSFYKHFRDKYYEVREHRDLVLIFRYFFHEGLHLKESMRYCGPISFLSQWPMETNIGYINRRCNSKNKCVESILSNVSFECNPVFTAPITTYLFLQ